MKLIYRIVICSFFEICLMVVCSTFSSCNTAKTLQKNRSTNLIYKDETIDIIKKNNSDTLSCTYIVYNNLDIGKYRFIGEIHEDTNTIQFVSLSYYFNVIESVRCNSRILIYINKRLDGYYMVDCDRYSFSIVNNVLQCTETDNPHSSTLLFFDVLHPLSWRIQHTDSTVDDIPYEKADSFFYSYIPYYSIF